MDKMRTFKELRKQLAAEYESEILAVNDIMANGVESVGGPQSILNTSTRDPDSAIGDARRAMADEIQSTVRMVMQRYAKNLEEEIAELGLLKKEGERVNVSLSTFDRDWTPEPPIDPAMARPAAGATSDDGPVLTLRNPFQEPSGAQPASPTAFLDRTPDAPRRTKNGANKPN